MTGRFRSASVCNATAPTRTEPNCRHLAACKVEPFLAHLREVAEWILPKVERPLRFDRAISDNILLYDPGRHNRLEVTVTITILHRMQPDALVHICEVSASTRWKARSKSAARAGQLIRRRPGLAIDAASVRGGRGLKSVGGVLSHAEV